MRKAKRLLIVVLALVLSMAMLVACNDDKEQTGKYTLKYSGGEGYVGEVPGESSLEAGSEVTLGAALSWAGHIFVAWEYDGQEYAAGSTFTMPDRDVTFVAKWSVDGGDPTTYTLSYACGSVYTGTVPASQSYEEGATVTLEGALIQSGYTFDKWTYNGHEYEAGATFTMPASNVSMTAKWSESAPEAQELGDAFYTASNWQYMTSQNGAEQDGGDIPYSLSDGSIKFHRLNQAVEIGKRDNGAFSFMLKATNDFHFWMNSTGKDNQGSNSYRLSYEYGGLRLEVDGSLAATVTDSTYRKAEWNRFDVVFKTVDNKTSIGLWINGEKATLALDTMQGVALDDMGNVVHTRPARFEMGGYAVVKVWEANNYVQFKPVSKASEKDVPIVAAVGASITEGAGAGNFYTESYPAQLQNILGGDYNVVNFGKSGRTVRTDTGVEDNNTPVPWLENLQFEGFKALKPDMVIINMGTNDSKTSLEPVSTVETFKAAYKHLIDELLEVNPELRVIVCTVPYAYSDIYDINNNNIENIIAPVQRQVAEEREYELVDLFEITKNTALLFTDGVHPGTTGYHMFAEILEKVVKGSASDLTEEFLNGINDRYNDPEEYSIENIHGEITVESGEITLTVTGNIKIDQKYHEFFKLDLNTGDAAQQSRSVTFDTTDDEGNFSVKARLDDLTGTSWYNVRVYYSEFASYLLTLDDVDHVAGNVFKNTERKVTVQTWKSGDKDVFSLQIADLSASDKIVTEITSVAITTTDGVKLTVSGTTNAEQLTFYAGVHPTEEGKWRTTELITIEGGAFTHTFDLNKLFDGAAIVSDYINIRLYYEDGSYVVVPLDKTTIDGVQAATGNSFIGEGKKFTIQSWFDSGVGTLSIVVSEYDDSYSIAVSEVKFENGNVVISGTYMGNVESITAYMYETQEASEAYNGLAELNDGNFVARVGLEQLQAAAGNWYFVQLSVNGGARQGVTIVPVDPDDFYMYNFRSYKWENANSTNLAVNYSNFNTSITKAEINDVEGRPMLTIEGMTKDAAIEANTMKLILSKTQGSKEFETNNTSVEAGHFAFTFDLSVLDCTAVFEPSGLSYFLRLYVNDAKYDDINSRWAADKLFNAVAVGDNEYCFSRNSASAWNTLGVMRKDNNIGITYTEIKFESGKLVVSGTVGGGVKSLLFTLHNDSDTSNTLTATADLSDSSFTVSFTLSECTLNVHTWYYLYVNVNDSGEQNVPSTAVDKENAKNHTYEGRVYRWQIDYENLAIDYEDAPVEIQFELSITEIAFEGGNLNVGGTFAGASKLTFSLFASEDSNAYTADASITESQFEASIPLPPKGAAHNGSWYRLQVASDDGGAVTVTWDKVQSADTFKALTSHYGNYNYSFVDNNDIAISTGDYNPALPEEVTVTLSEIRFDGNNLIVKGTATGTSVLKIELHAGEDVAKYSVDVTLQGEEFEATIALPPTADAHSGSWYRLRVKASDDEATGYTNLTWDGNASEIKEVAKALTYHTDSYEYRFQDTDDIALVYGK